MFLYKQIITFKYTYIKYTNVVLQNAEVIFAEVEFSCPLCPCSLLEQLLPVSFNLSKILPVTGVWSSHQVYEVERKVEICSHIPTSSL